MSGGHFNYKQHGIFDIADDIEQMVSENDSTELDEYDYRKGYGFPPEIIERFKEAVVTLRKAGTMAQRVDWLASGDDGEESFMRRWDEELKKLKEITK